MTLEFVLGFLFYRVDKNVVGVVAGRSEPDKEKQTGGLKNQRTELAVAA